MSTGADSSERIVDYYSYLFTFPSRAAMVVATFIISVGASLAAFTISGAHDPTEGLLYGIIGLAFPLLLTDQVILPLFKGEVVLNPRRFTILTFVSSIVFAPVILLSATLGPATGRPDYILRGILLSAAVTAALRHLSIRVFIPETSWRTLAAAFLQPVAFLFAAPVLLSPSTLSIILGILTIVITSGGVELLLWSLGRWREGPPGVELVPLFQTFATAWTEGLSRPLEEEITQLGEVAELPVDTLAFRNKNGRCLGALLVPYIHPGPFRNVGSSELPRVLSERVGQELGCEVLVAHGVSTHSRDLTRSSDNEIVAERILENLWMDSSSSTASPMVWAEREGAKASCQIFGDTALVTLTLSPKSYDDLPEEVAERIMAEATCVVLEAVVVDSHNSISLDGGLDDYDAEDVVQAAVEALSLAVESNKAVYRVSSARLIPDEWGIDEGMGPNGIAALLVRLENGRTSAYIVVDGNNMLSGLRERIVGAVKTLGIEGVEVMTSDIHLVNAIGATERGYSPFGEAMEERKIIGYATGLVEKALGDFQICGASHSRTVIPGLIVLGERGLEALRHVLESGFALFRRNGLMLAAACLLLSVLITFLH
ncbi:MAG: DUF2070 family protein [Candidatus Bathyarchaeota archaeon]|nr:MAG: DUF2070 family protein [Candidatus Bathyarchaeota archaeon]